VANTLAYYGTELIVALKSLIVQVPGLAIGFVMQQQNPDGNNISSAR
jgi:hypothetical protein